MSLLRSRFFMLPINLLLLRTSFDAWDVKQAGDEPTSAIGACLHPRDWRTAALPYLASSMNRGATYEVRELGFFRRRKKELELINSTQKRVLFLVMPTSVTLSAVMSLAVSLAGFGAGATYLDRDELVQVLKIPPGGQQRCWLPFKGGQARVSLITIDEDLLSLWFTGLFRTNTRLTVLPAMFAEGMRPTLVHRLTQDSHGNANEVCSSLIMIVCNMVMFCSRSKSRSVNSPIVNIPHPVNLR